MKINSNIEEYNVTDLEGMQTAVGEMKGQCELLGELGLNLKACIAKARADGFNDPNADMADAAVEQYFSKLLEMEEEYAELMTSIEEYIEKMRRVWSAWR